MDLPFEQFPALSAIGMIRHVFTRRIPGIDVSHDKATVLNRLDAAHCEIRNAIGIADWPLMTAEQVHENKIAVMDSATQFRPRLSRLSPRRRGEDEAEGLDPTSHAPTLTLPLGKGEASQHMPADVQQAASSEMRESCSGGPVGREFPDCDGIITNQRAIALGIYVADCCAVYIVDRKTPAVGLVHSGRKGTDLGAVTNAIGQMIARFGSDPTNIIVQLSPCIRPPHYEVDFAADIVRQCRELGVKDIHDCGICTACDLDRCYSYRAEKGKTGRMLAVIGLNPPITD